MISWQLVVLIVGDNKQHIQVRRIEKKINDFFFVLLFKKDCEVFGGMLVEWDIRRLVNVVLPEGERG